MLCVHQRYSLFCVLSISCFFFYHKEVEHHFKKKCSIAELKITLDNILQYLTTMSHTDKKKTSAELCTTVVNNKKQMI